ncbi:hypothetical protein KPL70_019626 [Citrus sinensis]|nr:hypothetical protein KPL70_019626 [Citrus sinensis]
MTVSSFDSGSSDVNGVLDFVDSRRELILAADESASDFIRNIAAEFAVDFDEDTQAMAIDHLNFAEGDHTLIASDGFIQSNVIIGTSRSVYAANSLVLKMPSASPSAYYANWVSHHSSFSFAGDEQFVTELSKMGFHESGF